MELTPVTPWYSMLGWMMPYGLIKRVGPGCHLAKTDIKNAFRIIPIHPFDYNLLGMKWQDFYFRDLKFCHIMDYQAEIIQRLGYALNAEKFSDQKYNFQILYLLYFNTSLELKYKFYL